MAFSPSYSSLFTAGVLFLIFPLSHAVVSSVFQFGDSLSDTGNLIRTGLAMEFGAFHLPYGETFFHQPTGRFSDGRLVVDYLADHFKLPFIQPYLKTGANFTQGVDFAVAGATALDQDFFTQRGISFDSFKPPISTQLQWFDKHLSSTCGKDCEKMVSEALFIFGEYGGNDYFTSFNSGKSLEEVSGYVPDVVNAVMQGVREIIDIGAKKILVPGPFPFGCLPSQLTSFPSSDPAAYDDLGCLKAYNDLAQKHYSALKTGIDLLKEEFSGEGVSIVLGDFYGALIDVMKNVEILGFNKESLLKACCGTGGNYNYDAGKVCGADGVTACPDPSKYVHWDGVHLTDAAYGFIGLYVAKDLRDF